MSNPLTAPIEPNAILVEFAVYMGDHAETKRSAIAVTRETTLGELLDAWVTKKQSNLLGEPPILVANEDMTIEIRGNAR